jgi:hypothetical protein
MRACWDFEVVDVTYGIGHLLCTPSAEIQLIHVLLADLNLTDFTTEAPAVTVTDVQVPCNILFLFTGGPVLLGVIAIAWGVAAAAQAAISGRTSFLLVRLFLGVAEAGTVPGALYGLKRETCFLLCFN